MKTIKYFSQVALLTALLSMASITNAQNNGVKFPDISKTYLKTGDFVDVNRFKDVGLGENRQQVMLVLGNPHFNEGIGSPDAFNYVFNFYTNKSKGDYITCQYQVTFNDKHRSSGTYWKDKQCEDFVEHANDKPAPVAPPPPRQPIRLSADGMFAFGKSGLGDLQATGREKLQALAAQIRNSGSSVRSVDVVGFTDRIGNPNNNLILSRARAETVKQFFVSQGIDGNLIRTSGLGAANPVAFCDGAATPAVIQCLLPNRRIEVMIEGER